MPFCLRAALGLAALAGQHIFVDTDFWRLQRGYKML
jgi:hypothetical protein